MNSTVATAAPIDPPSAGSSSRPRLLRHGAWVFASVAAGLKVVTVMTHSPRAKQREEDARVTARAKALQIFLKAHDEIQPRAPAPLQIATGMLVRTVRSIDANDVVITGSVWQRV